MKRNILITGFDNKLTENVARELADCLSLYYLSIPDLTLYYANRASKEIGRASCRERVYVLV